VSQVETLDRVANLVDRNLLGSVPTDEDGDEADGTRFAMLETIREFGLEQLRERGEERAARQAHAAYVSGLAEQAAEQLGRLTVAPWFDRLERERANLRDALAFLSDAGEIEATARFVIALFGLWNYRGPLREGISYTEKALAHSGELTADLRVRLLIFQGILRWVAGDGDRAGEDFSACATLARSIGLDCIAAMATNHLALIPGWDRQEYDKAIPLFLEAVTLARASSSDDICWALPFSLGNLGMALTLHGNPQRGVRFLEEAIELDRKRGSDFGEAMRHYHLGLAAQLGGNSIEAARRYAESLRLHWSSRVITLLVPATIGLAGLAAAAGRFESAARLHGIVEAIRERTGIPRDRGSAALWLPIYTQTERDVRAALGEDGFAAGVAAGRALPLDDAVAEALACAEVAIVDAPFSTIPSTTVVQPRPGSSAVDPFGLSSRESEVLRLLAQRYTDPEIAESLFISPRTASRHVANLFNKLGVNSRREAAALAARHGLC
jgi:non-specific serine/threonine protein kinase